MAKIKELFKPFLPPLLALLLLSALTANVFSTGCGGGGGSSSSSESDAAIEVKLIRYKFPGVIVVPLFHSTKDNHLYLIDE